MSRAHNFPLVLDKTVKLKGRNLLVRAHKDMEGKLKDRKAHMLIPKIPSVVQAREDSRQKTLGLTSHMMGTKLRTLGLENTIPFWRILREPHSTER